MSKENVQAKSKNIGSMMADNEVEMERRRL
jgi:hypothetical protein